MLEAPDPMHSEALLEEFARRELKLTREDLRWMSDEALRLAVDAWSYTRRRVKAKEAYAERWRRWRG